jgi:predicted Zn-dependent peptidase
MLLGTMPRAGAADTGTGASQILRTTLDNGLKVVIVRNTLAPVVTTAVNYLVGSNEAPAGFPGMAHAQEHMMFRGGPELSAAQLSYLSAAMGGEFDASTQQTMTQYVFTVAAEDLDVALRVEAIRMRGVSDSEAAWRQERGAIEQEVAQNLSNPQYLLYTKLLAALFEGTPYARDALGTKASFDRTTGAMLKKFGDTWYAPNNAILVVVGDVQPDAALARIKTHFGRLRPKALPRRPDVVLRPVRPRTLYLPTDQASGLAVVAFRGPGFADADYAAMRVLADVLGSSRGVLQDLVADGTLLDAGFSFSPLPRAGLAFGAAAFPQDKSPSLAFGELTAVLRATADKGVDADLVEAAKLRAISRAEFQKTSIPGLASAWSEALAVEGRQSPSDEVAAIQRVTVADVNRVARRYLDFDRAITAIMTPRPSGNPCHLEGVRREGVVHPAEHEAGRAAGLGGKRGEAAGGAAVVGESCRHHAAQWPLARRAARVGQQHDQRRRARQDAAGSRGAAGPGGGRRGARGALRLRHRIARPRRLPESAGRDRRRRGSRRRLRRRCAGRALRPRRAAPRRQRAAPRAPRGCLRDRPEAGGGECRRGASRARSTRRARRSTRRCSRPVTRRCARRR